MRVGCWCLPFVVLALSTVRPMYAGDLRSPRPLASAVSFDALLDKEFPFDPSDKRPPCWSPDCPFGEPVHGRPGLAVSPYAPDAGYVDVRGYKRCDEVRCPYTGKIFLVP